MLDFFGWLRAFPVFQVPCRRVQLSRLHCKGGETINREGGAADILSEFFLSSRGRLRPVEAHAAAARHFERYARRVHARPGEKAASVRPRGGLQR